MPRCWSPGRRGVEAAGWDGWYLMDHVVHQAGDESAVDPWMARGRRPPHRPDPLGPTVSSRHRPWDVARQAAAPNRLTSIPGNRG